MLSATDLAFTARYPHGTKVFDAWGRRIRYVQSCNPETGEVIRCESAGGGCVAANVTGGPWYRHGFWPAPLRVVAREPWLGYDPEHAVMIIRAASALLRRTPPAARPSPTWPPPAA